MVHVPAVTFRDGPNENKTVSAFDMDVFEATVAQYRPCVNAGVCALPQTNADMKKQSGYGECNWEKTEHDNHPINCIARHDADSFCKWAGKRLPTLPEWEAAARAGASTLQHCAWENPDAGDTDWACTNRASGTARRRGYEQGTCPVGSHPHDTNSLGLYDIVGNVSEWTSTIRKDEVSREQRPDEPDQPTSNVVVGYVYGGGMWLVSRPVYACDWATKADIIEIFPDDDAKTAKIDRKWADSAIGVRCAR